MGSESNNGRSSFTLKQVLWFSAPALILGLALRVFLLVNMPSAFFISDTREFVDSDNTSLLDVGNPFKRSSRTFLAKVIYTAPLTFGKPNMPYIPAVQHLFGLGLVFGVGVLCALWTRYWKIWIIPLTTTLAVHPTLLWYEHMALPDSTSVALVALTSAAGGLYYCRPTWGRLIGLSAALFLMAGARQESFLFLPLGLLMVLLRHRGELRSNLKRVGVVAAVCLLAFLGSQTSQGGQMLLTSTVHMAPDKLWSKPAFSADAVALREEFKPRWPSYPDKHNSSRKIIVKRVQDHLDSLGSRSDASKSANSRLNNSFCKDVAIEIALRNWWRMPGIAINKFLATHLEEPSPGFDQEWLHEKHLSIMFGKPDERLPKDHKNMEIYFGRTFASKEEFAQWLKEAYPVQKLEGLRSFQAAFVRFTVESGFPSRVIQGQTLPGLPYVTLAGLVGLIAAALLKGENRTYRLTWVLLLFFQAFIVFSTSSLRSRYRLVYEPWIYVGVFCTLDFLVLFAVNSWKAAFSHRAPRKTIPDGTESVTSSSPEESQG